ncbi:ABC transporter substrate-binding protein, partial [Escherichia coli]|uniref:ABC transporter substrate-binding protein n=1 Tax=Escherichia coli TaxID=562 RepID=UPI00207B6B95
QLAIDRQAIQRAVMRGLSVPTNIIAPPFVHGYEKSFGAVGKADLAQARKLLAEAGYPNGFGITPALHERPLPERRGHLPGHRRLFGPHRREDGRVVPAAGHPDGGHQQPGDGFLPLRLGRAHL